MINSFDSDVAKDVGVIAAILYHNIKYWCEKNATNEVHFHDGHYWTYNSIKAFCSQFPYLSRDQINYALKKLEESGYIKTGNYNKSAYDRTKWYCDLYLSANADDTISDRYEMDLPSIPNEIGDNTKPIPNINTNNNQITNLKENVKKKFDAIAYLDTIPVINEHPDLKQAFVDYIEMRQASGHPVKTEQTMKLAIKRAFEYGDGKKDKIIAVLEQSTAASYQGIFALKGQPGQSDSVASGSKANGSNNPMAILDAIIAEETAKEAAT